eukprot:10016575-Karenia_brevis.AAC.1
MAESGRVAIGGWLVPENYNTPEARWFFLEVPEQSLPIVSHERKDRAFRSIASLEPLGMLLGRPAFVGSNNLKGCFAEVSI